MNEPRILIVAPSWVGDAVISEPLIAQIKEFHVNAAIDIFAPPWCLPVYQRMHHVQRVIENPLAHGEMNWTRRKNIALSLQATAYDQVFVLPNSWKSALIPYLAKIPKRTGYTGEARLGLLNDRRALDKKQFPRLVDRFVALAHPVGTPKERIEATIPVLISNAQGQQQARASLKLSDTAPVAVFCPGAEYGAAKRWPPEYFAELAQHLLEEGMQIWLIGSPKDQPVADAIIATLGDTPRVHNLVGQTTLDTAIDLIATANIAISNDSGLMHIAAAVNVSLIALFGSSSPLYTPPLSPHAQVLRIDLPCSPCFKRECPLKHFRCMRDLTPEIVLRHVREQMAGIEHHSQ